MAQDIKYILLKNELEVPADMVHFVENDALIIPVDFYDGEFEQLMDGAVSCATANDILNFIIDKVLPEDSVVGVAQYLKSTGLSTFVIASYRESLSAYPWAVFKNNERKPVKDFNLDPHGLIGITNPTYYDIVNNEGRYHSYDDAFYEYFKNDPVHGV